MPLLTQIIDAGTTTPRKIRWGWWHVECMTDAARAHVPETKDLPILEVWSHRSLQAGLTIEFPMGFKDPFDGEVFILSEGDRLKVWRQS